MTVRVNRESVISWLEQVRSGLSQPGKGIDQGDCFVFVANKVMTFNDQICCRKRTELNGDIQIAVKGHKLLELLHSMTEEEIELGVVNKDGDKKLLVKGKGRRKGRVNGEAEIKLAVEEVEEPAKEAWKKVPDRLSEALGMVKECCGKDTAKSEYNYVHLHPDYVEASDNYQTARFHIKTGLTESFLIKRPAITEVAALGMTRMAESPGWLHFRNKDGLIISCRRYLEDYPDPGPMLKFDGVKVALPKAVKGAALRAGVFSAENEKDYVRVELAKNEITVVGLGNSGEWRESKDVKYSGRPIKFMISPKILVKLVEDHNNFIIEEEISPVKGRIKAESGDYIFSHGSPNASTKSGQ